MIWWLWHFVKTFSLKVPDLNIVQADWSYVLQRNMIKNDMTWRSIQYIPQEYIYYKLGLGLYRTYFIICITYNIQSSSWKYAHRSDFWDVCDPTLRRWYLIDDKNEIATQNGILALAEIQKIISHLIPFYRTNVFHLVALLFSSTFNPLNFEKHLSISALDYQSENENIMAAYEFIYTQKLSVMAGRGEKK